MVVACSVLLTACLLAFPAINNSRYHAQIATCQNNLRSIGRALIEYSGVHSKGFFPQVPESGNLAVAGMYAPTLKELGLITEDHNYFCPSSAELESDLIRKIPTLEEVKRARGQTLAVAQMRMGGDYGYSLGVRKRDGRVGGIRNRSRTHFAIMSDSPKIVRCGESERRDWGLHRNVLFESGGVRVVCINTDCWRGDSLFTNDDGEISAGVNESDTVIGASDTTPTTMTVACEIEF